MLRASKIVFSAWPHTITFCATLLMQQSSYVYKYVAKMGNIFEKSDKWCFGFKLDDLKRENG